jgi:prephenate dehydratase
MIVAEHYQRIKLCLVGLEKVALSQIRNVYSHPMAIMQAEDYIKHYLRNADIHERPDTAEAVEFVKSQKDILSVAIASRKAAKLHHLKVIADSLEKDKNNYTRFIALKPKTTFDISSLDKAKKTSIILELANRPGSLFEALKTFKDENVNLSKIESRPIVGKKWRYYFYLDYETGINTVKSRRILDNLQKKGNNLRILGSYKQDEVIA